MPKVSKGVWGIDIGQCALKAIRLEMIDGTPTATAFDYVEHPKILSQPDAEPDMLIREALDKFLSRNQIKHDDVAIGIAGQSGLARFVKLPPVEEKKIAEIVKFEAKQQIPFPLDEVVWDFQKIAGGEVMDGFAMETEIGLFAMKRDVIARYMGYFAGSRVEVHHVQMSPLALVNYTTYDILKKGGQNPPADAPEGQDPGQGDQEQAQTPRGKKRCVVVLDIGTEASNLIITDGGKIIWQRPIPLGGNNFTRALTKELKLTFAKAEHLKRNAAKSPELPQILKALKPVLTDFVGEVQRSLGYFTNTHRDAHVAYMIGLGSAFRLPGLQKYLSEKLTLEVKKPDKFARLAGDSVLNDPLFKENMLTFPVAYGLALQGLSEARLNTNLLPPEIRTERLIRAKKPFAVAAAALLLIGSVGLALGEGSKVSSYRDKQIDKAVEVAKTAGTTANRQKSRFESAVSAKQAAELRVAASQAGQRERLNWARFEEVLSAALPKPGPKGNLPPDVWEAVNEKSGIKQGPPAVNWYLQKLRGDFSVLTQLTNKDEQDHLPNLAIVNIEAIHTRYVTDLNLFLTTVDDRVYDPAKKGFNENIAQWMRPEERVDDPQASRPKPKLPAEGSPEYAAWKEGAWVVEIRGYTNFPGKDSKYSPAQFINRAVLENLRRFDEFAIKTGDGKVANYVPGRINPVREPARDDQGNVIYNPKKDNKGNVIKDDQGNPVPDKDNPAMRSRVSHAFIFHVWTDENPMPGTFKEIGRSYLDELLPASTAQQGGTGGGPPPGMGPPGEMGGSAGGPPPGMGTGGTGAASSTAVPAGPAWTGLQSSFPDQGGALAGRPKTQHEFVVMFIWREPLTPTVTPPK